MAQLALSVVGRDRPGIVAAVTGVLLRHGVNVEDSEMAILRGHFTMMLMLGASDDLDRAALAADLDAAASGLGLEALTLNDVDPLSRGLPEPTHVVTVYGVDHPGIIHRTALTLAERGANITDLETRLVQESGTEPLYALMMEIVIPEGVDPAEVDRELAAVAERETVEVSLRELERDEL